MYRLLHISFKSTRLLILGALCFISSMQLNAQIGVRLEFDACVRNDTLFIDLFATDTVNGGTGFAFGGSNFVFDVINPATGFTSASVAMGSQTKIDTLDGPWDDTGIPNTANGDYFNMTINTGVNAFVNMTIVPDEANLLLAGPNTGFVMTDGVQYHIGGVAIPVLVCADLVSLRWRTNVNFPFGGGGTINQWNAPGADLRAQMGFHNLEDVILCNNVCASSLLGISGSDSVCTGGVGTYSIPQASFGDSIYWYVNGALINAGTNNGFQHTFNSVDTIWAEVVNGTCVGCPNSQTDTFILGYLNPPVTVNAGPDTTASVDSAVLLDITATNAFTFQWIPGTGLSDSLTEDPLAGPMDTTEYIVFAYGTDTNCFGTDTVIVNVIPNDYSDLIVRNFVSPNGDGKNDFWTVNDTTVISGCDVRIYSRWGITVYESIGYQNDWDGTSNGKQVSDGTYYYVISCGDFEQTGAITLVR